MFKKRKNNNVVPWPYHSPDLNLMENLWGMLCHKVYANKLFSSVNELEVAIVKEWDNISESELNYLITPI